MSFTLYATDSGGEEPRRFILNARSFGISSTHLQELIPLLERFPKRGGYDSTDQVYAVARLDEGRHDSELTLIFGWGADGGWWTPFFKIPVKQALAMSYTGLQELVTKQSLTAVERTRVAIGCG
jgi:hypothetical protein